MRSMVGGGRILRHRDGDGGEPHPVASGFAERNHPPRFGEGDAWAGSVCCSERQE